MNKNDTSMSHCSFSVSFIWKNNWLVFPLSWVSMEGWLPFHSHRCHLGWSWQCLCLCCTPAGISQHHLPPHCPTTPAHCHSWPSSPTCGLQESDCQTNWVRSPQPLLKTYPKLLTQFWIKQKGLSNPEPALRGPLHSPLILSVCILFCPQSY